jgi:hypothetical protein
VTGGWRKLHNEELRCFNYSRNIIRMTKSRRMRWVGHVARMQEIKNTKFWLESLKEIDNSEGIDVDGG